MPWGSKHSTSGRGGTGSWNGVKRRELESGDRPLLLQLQASCCVAANRRWVPTADITGRGWLGWNVPSAEVTVIRRRRRTRTGGTRPDPRYLPVFINSRIWSES